LGLSGEAVDRYADEWIDSIIDITPIARRIHKLVQIGNLDEARQLLPSDSPYPVPEDVVPIIGADDNSSG